jgi:phospholipid/cholesterol/gamma-HCH transport system substrate-binding protein
MMKISNETKVGALTAISITLLILGFNFLKGKNVFAKKSTMYVTFKRVEGLNVADGIKINGLRVGAVEGLEEKDMNLSEVVVAFQLHKEINIPTDSYAKIVATPLGSTAIIITMGNAKTFLNEGDTLKGIDSKSMVEDLKETLQPTVENVNKTLATLDSTIRKIGNVFDAEAKQNIGRTLEELASTTSRLNTLLEPNKGSLAQTLENVKGFTGNLKQNNDSITAVVNNLTKASRDLSSADISHTIASLEKATTTLNAILLGIKEGKGSLGKLTTDEQLYKNLNSTSNSLNILLQDLRIHPKRYVQVSVFGKKDKTAPLMSPLTDSLSKQQ